MEHIKRTRIQRTIPYILGTIILLSVVPMSMAITQGQISLINQLMADIKSGTIKSDAARKRAHEVTMGLSPTNYMIEKLVEVAENAPTPIPNILGKAPEQTIETAAEEKTPKQGKTGKPTPTTVEKEVPQTPITRAVVKPTPQQQSWMKTENVETEKQKKEGTLAIEPKKSAAVAAEKTALFVPLSIDSTKINIKLLEEVINNLYALYEKIKNRSIEDCSTNPFTKAYRASNVHIIALCKDPDYKSDHFDNLQLSSASHARLAKMKEIYTIFCINDAQADIDRDLFEVAVVKMPKDLKHADPKTLKMLLSECTEYLARISEAAKQYIDRYALDFYKKAEDTYKAIEKEIATKKAAEPVPVPQPEPIKPPEQTKPIEQAKPTEHIVKPTEKAAAPHNVLRPKTEEEKGQRAEHLQKYVEQIKSTEKKEETPKEAQAEAKKKPITTKLSLAEE
jgi:hypothetical protein